MTALAPARAIAGARNAATETEATPTAKPMPAASTVATIATEITGPMAGIPSHPSGASATSGSPTNGGAPEVLRSRNTEDTEVRGDTDRREGMVTLEELVEAAPVFASGNAELERRLLRTFAALSLPKCGADLPLLTTAVGADRNASSTAGVEASGAQAAAAASDASAAIPGPKEGPAVRRQQPAAEAAVGATASNAATDQQTPAPGKRGSKATTTALVTADCQQETCAAAIPTTHYQQQRAVSPRTRAGVEANPDAATGTAVGLERAQQQPVSREPSMPRPESPGAWSEATDSTGCTESSDIVRPPAYGSWRHFSLADVPDEATSLRGMQRACHLILLQRRQAAGVDTNSSITTRVASSASIAVGEEAPDPRVRVGPRWRG